MCIDSALVLLLGRGFFVARKRGRKERDMDSDDDDKDNNSEEGI
jgi:hypothetical protein